MTMMTYLETLKSEGFFEIHGHDSPLPPVFLNFIPPSQRDTNDLFVSIYTASHLIEQNIKISLEMWIE